MSRFYLHDIRNGGACVMELKWPRDVESASRLAIAVTDKQNRPLKLVESRNGQLTFHSEFGPGTREWRKRQESVTKDEIRATELGELLFGAKSRLSEALSLINEHEHLHAWGSTFSAFHSVDQAIRCLKQDYARKDEERKCQPTKTK